MLRFALTLRFKKPDVLGAAPASNLRAVVLMIGVLAATSFAQVWNEPAGLELSRSVRWKPAPVRSLGPHHELLLWGFDAGESTRLVLQGLNGRQTHELGGGTIVVHRGVPARRYRPPLLAPGSYRLVNGAGGKLRALGEFRVSTFRCYFNHPGDPLQAATTQAVIPHVVLQEVMARCIDKAQSTVDVAMSDFDHAVFLTAVERAKRRGVAVRLVTDARTAGGEAAARARLDAEGIPWISNERDVTKDPMMHHKFIIVDNVLTLSGHAKADRAHAVFNQSFVSIHDTGVATVYRDEFERMWGGEGPISPKEKRRFGVAKQGPREYRVDVEIRGKPIPVTIVFSPELVATPDLAGRPINRKLCELIGKARFDVSFMATGFDDPDVANAMITASRERDVQVFGVSGHPDWTMVRRPALLSLIAEPDPPADVVGSYDQTDRGDFCSVQNRALVIDTIDPRGHAIACFASGPWRKGRHESDDAVICIPDREVAEQYLQHVGGTRMRAFRPLAPRMRPLTVRLREDRLEAPLDDVAVMVGATVSRRPNGTLVITRGELALVVGSPGLLGLANVEVLRATDLSGEADRPWIALDALMPLGVGLSRDEKNQLVLCGAPLVRFAMQPSDDATAERLTGIAIRGADEQWSPGIVFASGDPAVELATPPIRTDEAGSALITADRLVALESAAPDVLLKPEEGAKEEMILALPDVAIGFAESIRRWRAADSTRPSVHVLEGAWGPLGRGSLWTTWRPALGEGLVFRLDGAISTTDLNELLFRLGAAGFNQIGLDEGFVGESRSLRSILVREPEKEDWKEVSGGLGLRSNARQLRVELFSIGKDMIQARFSRWSSPRLRRLR